MNYIVFDLDAPCRYEGAEGRNTVSGGSGGIFSLVRRRFYVLQLGIFRSSGAAAEHEILSDAGSVSRADLLSGYPEAVWDRF